MGPQLTLPVLDDTPDAPDRIGKAVVRLLPTASILATAQGFMGDYDYTLNPYIGCQFGCAYCYAAFFANSRDRQETWGDWVDVKTGALQQLARKRVLRDKRIYMSSVTDPYQPIETKLQLTRSILEFLAVDERQPRLVVQTRSPLVVRDIDVYRRFRHLRVNVTVTTDSDAIRKRFEPLCPSIDRRLEALEKLKAAGLRTAVCITPMLPLEDPIQFAKRLAQLRADIYVAQPFKPSAGPYAASTRRIAFDILRDYSWNEDCYRRAVRDLRAHLPHLYEGREGFMPE